MKEEDESILVTDVHWIFLQVKVKLFAFHRFSMRDRCHFAID